MSFPSMRRLAACSVAVSLAAGLSACGPGVSEAWTAPGWYLEKSYITVLGGPKYVGGPFSYEKCEEERIKLPKETATQMLCVRENRKPEKYGLY